MIRVVLAAALTTALLAAAMPAVDEGRTDRTATRLSAVSERLERAVQSLRDREDAVSRGVPGARRVVRFRLPAASWSAAPFAYFAVGGRPASDREADTIRYRIEGRPSRTVPLPVALRTPGGPVVFREPGAHAVVLRLVDGGAVVVERG